MQFSKSFVEHTAWRTHPVSIVIRVLAALLLLQCLWLSSCSKTTIYIVRHAEKDTVKSADPPLTSAGLQRSQDLALLLKNDRLAKIYSTNFIRTLATVQPTADQHEISVSLYNTIPELGEMLSFGNKKNILIAGHSNTILEIAEMLGTNPVRQQIEDTDYDNLLIVKKTRFLFWDKNVLEETTYGAPTLPE